MAYSMYALGKQALLGAMDLTADTIKMQLVDGDYTPNFTTDDAAADFSGSEVGTAATLASKTVALGVFDAADVTYSAVSGNVVVGAVIYKDAGNLICYLDFADITPNGNDIIIQFDAAGIFAM